MEVGDYRIIKKLGEGTFAEVLQARHKKSGKLFAMKRFKKQFRNVDEIEALREIQALRRLNLHPNIIQLEEVIFDAKYGILSLSFELMDHNLYDVLAKKGSPPIAEAHAKWIMWQVTKAMDFVHGKGVFHRDVKPENILVRGDIHTVPLQFPALDQSSPWCTVSSFPLVKLADFGSCRGIHSRMPYTEYIATRWYRSPECLLFDGIYSYKMDIWGVGCVLYELVTRLPIFPGDNELDQLQKIHNVFGTPSERLLKVMVAAGTQAMLVTPNGQRNTKAAGHLVKGIWKHKFNFTPTKGTGLRAAFPQHIVNGGAKSPLPRNSTHSPSDFPGLSDACLNLLELLLQYDPDARPSARQMLKHPWLKECRDAEIVERQLNTSIKDISLQSSFVAPPSTTGIEATPQLAPTVNMAAQILPVAPAVSKLQKSNSLQRKPSTKVNSDGGVMSPRTSRISKPAPLADIGKNPQTMDIGHLTINSPTITRVQPLVCVPSKKAYEVLKGPAVISSEEPSQYQPRLVKNDDIDKDVLKLSKEMKLNSPAASQGLSTAADSINAAVSL